jgi:hypothetical protein
MRNVSDRSCRENQNTHFRLYNIFFSPSEIVPVVRQFKKNMGGPEEPQAITERGAEKKQFACRMTKARIQNYTHDI